MLRAERSSEFTVYLTFDDGPDPVATPQVLDMLEKHQVEATFFLVGQRVEELPEITGKIKLAGHVTHLHSWDHARPGTMPFRSFKEEMLKCAEKFGSRSYRPPYGKLPLRYLVWLRRNSFRIVLWNVDFCDYSPKVISDAEIIHLSKKIRNGDIILLHNNSRFFDKTLLVFNVLMKELKKKNVIFERIL